MAADIFGRRVHHKIRAVFDGPAQIGRCHGVIHEQRKTGIRSNGRYRLDVQHIVAGIADGLRVDYAGLVGDCRPEVFRPVRIDEGLLMPRLRGLTSNWM